MAYITYSKSLDTQKTNRTHNKRDHENLLGIDDVKISVVAPFEKVWLKQQHFFFLQALLVFFQLF